jgi:hypothetical protein
MLLVMILVTRRTSLPFESQVCNTAIWGTGPHTHTHTHTHTTLHSVNSKQEVLSICGVYGRAKQTPEHLN